MNSKVIRWLHGEIRTPPLSVEARREFGYLLRMAQEGEMLSMPHARPMPNIGNACHELRVKDAAGEWRLVFALTADAIVVLDVFKKATRETPQRVLEQCRRRLEHYRRDFL
jgi:phage-related protein